MQGDLPGWDLTSLPRAWDGETRWDELAPALLERTRALAARAEAVRGADDPALDELLPAFVRLDEELHAATATLGLRHAIGEDVPQDRLAFARGPLRTARDRAYTAVARVVASTDPTEAEALLARPALDDDVRRWVRSVRRCEPYRLSAPEEAMLAALSEHGVRAWTARYDRLRRAVRFPVDGALLTLSEVYARWPDPTPEHKITISRTVEAGMRAHARDFAEALTPVLGHRLAVSDRLGVSPLQVALAANACSERTFRVALETVDAVAPLLVRYLRARVRYLGMEAYDPAARRVPVRSTDRTAVTREEVEQRVVDAFEAFSPRMAAFARRAFEGRWIDWAPRDGKRQGGFCAQVGPDGQVRISVAFRGLPGDAATVAHELGHGYHAIVRVDAGRLLRGLPLALAETGSTFAERLLCRTPEDLEALDQDLEGSVLLLLDSAWVFRLEERMLEARRRGPLDADELCALSEACQREVFGAGRAHTMAWAMNEKFWSADRTFYNFAYAVGHLLSSRLAALALEAGPSFADRWDALLLASDDATVEELAALVGLDPTDPRCWDPFVTELAAKVERFEALTAG